jgi:hypothetical protein
VGVELLAGGASLVTTAVTALLVNARHLFYGVSMLERYSRAGRAKPYLIFSLTDETFSLVCAPRGAMGIGLYGPALDEYGNSVAAVRAMEHLSNRLGLHTFDI